jgi:hypothetical protein
MFYPPPPLPTTIIRCWMEQNILNFNSNYEIENVLLLFVIIYLTICYHLKKIRSAAHRDASI